MEKNKSGGYLCLFIMILSTLTGCYTVLDKHKAHSPQPVSPPGDPVESEVPDSLVDLSLSVTRRSVSRSYPIEVRVSVTNLSDRPVRLGNGHCPVFFLVSGNQGEYRAYIWGLARRLDTNARPYYLEPKESCSRKWSWKALVRQKGESSYRSLEPGDYMLIGTAFRYRSSPVPIRVVDE
ncbi:MAG TPA: hypothetical protein VKO43_04300 [Candidatus Krumholzibacteriaceae bacterium]|nr:hypothetical protein [Candidatus Krumholzibacteriaceae bacterium]